MNAHRKFSLYRNLLLTSTLLLSCILLSISNSTAQDSLLQRLAIEKDSYEKLSILRTLIRDNFYNNTELSDSCTNVYINIAKSIKNDSIYCTGLISKSSIKLVKADYDSAFYYTRLALKEIESGTYPLLKANALHISALTHYYKGDYEKSLEQNFESLRIKESESNTPLEIQSLTNIAITYERLKDYDNAIIYNNRALKLTPEDDLYSKAAVNNNVASILITQGKLKEALENLEKANKIAKEIDNKLLIVDTQIGLAKTNFSLGNYDIALDYAEDGTELSKALDNKAKYIASLTILGGIKMQKKDYNSALPILNNALQLSLENGIEETRIEIYQNLSKAYVETNDYVNDSRMKDSILQMKEKIFQKEKTKISEELNIKYETVKKENLLKENLINIEKQKNQKSLLLISSIFLMLLAASVFGYMRKRLQSNKKIAQQQSELKNHRIEQLEQENKILAMSSMIEGQESERKRIAQDLHDGLGGLLATIKVKFGIIQKEIEELESINVYNQTSSMIDDACAEVRKIAYNMMPDSLNKLGLIAAVKDIADYTTDLDIKVINLGMVKLSETKEIMLYRVIQEFITNTRKHAEASQVIIQFSLDNGQAIIDLEDDGKGYDIKESHSKGLGLKSMESRINFINGHIEMDSKVGIGTTLHIQIPTENTSSI